MKKGLFNRRFFLKMGLAGAASWSLSFYNTGKLFAQGTPTPVYRTLGRTGLKVTVVSFGAMLTPDPEVIRAGIDMGINYIDTARRYMAGRNEEIVGRAIKGCRDRVYIATKVLASSTTKEHIFQDVEKSLRALQTDHIDVIQLHNLTEGDRMFIPEVREALLTLRKQGKVRFFGITTHTNQAEVLNDLSDDKENFFDVALVAYNFKSDNSIKEAIAKAANRGIGIVAMKTQAGGFKPATPGISHHQAALKWVLQDSNVTAAIPGMRTFAELREDVAVMGMKLTRSDEKVLKQYSEAIKPYYCHLCAKCEPTCPNHAPISTINRSLMYAEGYGNLYLARQTYDEIRDSASVCRQCTTCIASCVHGVDIGMQINKARAIFG